MLQPRLQQNIGPKPQNIVFPINSANRVLANPLMNSIPRFPLKQSSNYQRGFSDGTLTNRDYPTVIRTNLSGVLSNPSSPLSLNISSPMYTSLPSSANSSPAMSPAHRDRLLSPYPKSQSPSDFGQTNIGSNKLLSIVSNASTINMGNNRVLQMNRDPFLTNKMQPSPTLLQKTEVQTTDMDSLLENTEFWMDTDILDETILNALGD